MRVEIKFENMNISSGLQLYSEIVHTILIKIIQITNCKRKGAYFVHIHLCF